MLRYSKDHLRMNAYILVGPLEIKKEKKTIQL